MGLLQEALANAKKMMANAEATQEEVDEVVSALSKAIDSLVRIQ